MAATSTRSALRTAVGSPTRDSDDDSADIVDMSQMFPDSDWAHDDDDDADYEPSRPIAASLRRSLRYTQEIPVLQEVFTNMSLKKSANLTHASLSDVSDTLAELLAKAIEREQSERVSLLLSFQEQLERLPHSFAMRNPDDPSPNSGEILILPPAKASLHSQLRRSVFGSTATSSSAASSSSSSSSSVTIDCPICFETYPSDAMFSFSTCGQHHYCSSCLAAHLLALITDAELHRISCPDPSCSATPLESDIQDFLPPDVFDKYLRFSVLAVLQSETVRWCPNTECAQPCLLADTCDDRAECPYCLTIFCVQCSKPFHPDTDCDGELLDENERLFSSWMRDMGVLVKECPSCHSSTEKNSGCNHMTCRCGTQWCWLCNEVYAGPHFGEGHCAGLQFAGVNSLLEAQLNNVNNNQVINEIRAEQSRRLAAAVAAFRTQTADELRQRVAAEVKRVRSEYLMTTYNQATKQTLKIFNNDGFKQRRRDLGREADAELETRVAAERLRLEQLYAEETERRIASAMSDDGLEARLLIIVTENNRRRQLNLPLHTVEEAAARQAIAEREEARRRQEEAQAREQERLMREAQEREARRQEAAERRAARQARQAEQGGRVLPAPKTRTRRRSQFVVRFGGAI